MSAVLPPAAVPAAPSAGGGPVTVTVAAGDARALAALQAGTALEVVTLARPAKGVLEVMTDQGALQLKVAPPATLPPLPEGARLLLQVGTGGSLTMLAVNGRPLAGAMAGGAGLPGGGLLAQSHRGGLAGGVSAGGSPFGGPLLGGGAVAGGAGAGGGSPPAAVSANPGQSTAAPAAPAPSLGLTATLIRPALPSQGTAVPQPGPMAAGLPANLPAGTQMLVRIAGIEPPGAFPGAGGVSVSAAPAQPAVGGGHKGFVVSPQAALPAPSLPSPLATSLVSAPAGGLAPPILAGTVTAHPPGGQAVLSTAIGTMAVPTADPLAVGSVLKLEVVAPPQPPPQPPPSPRPEGLSAQGWPALSETMETLARVDPQALDALMRTIPAAGPRLAAAMVAFSGAMKSGDGKGALGEAPAKALEKAGRRDLAERLRGDLAELAEDAGRPVGGGEWRMHTLPFSHGAQVDPIHLFVRGAAGEDERQAAGVSGGDQRFILDFHLSNLGRLQMDGLVRREDKLFDLIIRTGAPLPQRMRMDIMAIFTQAADLVGTKGTVAFQSGGRWVDIRTDQAGPTRIEV